MRDRPGLFLEGPVLFSLTTQNFLLVSCWMLELQGSVKSAVT